MTFPDRCPGPKDGPLKKKPTEYLKQLYYDNIMFTPEAMRHLVAGVGSSQVVVGTDYPYPWTKTAVDLVLATPGLTDAERVAMPGAEQRPGCSGSERSRGQVSQSNMSVLPIPAGGRNP